MGNSKTVIPALGYDMDKVLEELDTKGIVVMSYGVTIMPENKPYEEYMTKDVYGKFGTFIGALPENDEFVIRHRSDLEYNHIGDSTKYTLVVESIAHYRARRG